MLLLPNPALKSINEFNGNLSHKVVVFSFGKPMTFFLTRLQK